MQNVGSKEAISELKRLLAAVPDIRRATAKDEVFKKWRQDVIRALAVGFGSEESRTELFSEIEFAASAPLLEAVARDFPKVIHGKKLFQPPIAEAEKRHFQKALTEATGLLRSALDALEKLS